MTNQERKARADNDLKITKRFLKKGAILHSLWVKSTPSGSRYRQYLVSNGKKITDVGGYVARELKLRRTDTGAVRTPLGMDGDSVAELLSEKLYRNGTAIKHERL